jgi:hypothetical protein
MENALRAGRAGTNGGIPGAGGAMVLVVTLVERGQPRLMIYLIGLLCSAVIALVVGHVSMIRQLHALTTILRKSGALADHLPEASDPSALR